MVEEQTSHLGGCSNLNDVHGYGQQLPFGIPGGDGKDILMLRTVLVSSRYLPGVPAEISLHFTHRSRSQDDSKDFLVKQYTPCLPAESWVFNGWSTWGWSRVGLGVARR